VVFGHTHRPGPLPGDPESVWRCRGGTALWNTGSWVYDPGRVGAHDRGSPYWPGTLVTLEGSDPPRLHHLLETIPEGVGTARERGADARSRRRSAVRDQRGRRIVTVTGRSR
jgi:hypothetical protein